MKLLTLVLLSQLSSVDFLNNDVLARDTPLFYGEYFADTARVKAKKNIPTGALSSACRQTLMEPLRRKNLQRLTSVTQLELDSSAEFALAEITSFREESWKGWRYCTGTLVPAKDTLNLAGLAVIQAWRAFESNNNAILRPLVRVALAEVETQNDAVALVAVSTGGKKGLDYLEQNLSGNKFLLENSRIYAAELLIKAGQLRQALALLQPCREDGCAVRYQELEEAWQQQSAEDLQSYF